jgi:CelD/BcsL family acetyltransferase involved in cellulose biosynthesis
MADSVMLASDVADRAHGAVAAPRAGIAVRIAHAIADVEADWLRLAGPELDSPGQSPAFIRLWVEALGIAPQDQFYVVAAVSGTPVALLPLHRHRVKGVRLLSWFPGPHVGCNAPLVDRARLAAMTPQDRRALWRAMIDTIAGADIAMLRAVPETLVNGVNIFSELGEAVSTATLYRAQFASWDAANATQRNKSRRKHDRQQGEKLEALGAVTFEEIGNGPEAPAVLDVMFRQRAARFREMGVPDPFAPAEIRRFYDLSVRAESGIAVRLHVLRLDGEIVAVRYSIAEGRRLFCLISSMSTEPRLQPGSPGKQCLLHVMETVFDTGWHMFDMGAGMTDEKRHWCNVQIPLTHHYLPITWRGAWAALLHRRWQTLRTRIKSDERLLGLAKQLRSLMLRFETDRGQLDR